MNLIELFNKYPTQKDCIVFRKNQVASKTNLPLLFDLC